MSIENATVKPNVIGAFVKVDAQTLALTQEVLNHAHGLIQKVAGTRENTRQIRILEIFKGLTQRLSNPEMENAKSIPDVVRWLFQQELYASMLTNAGYTESSVDALLRRLVEMSTDRATAFRTFVSPGTAWPTSWFRAEPLFLSSTTS